LYKKELTGNSPRFKKRPQNRKKTNSKKTFGAIIPLECYLQNKTSTNFSFFGQQQSPPWSSNKWP